MWHGLKLQNELMTAEESRLWELMTDALVLLTVFECRVQNEVDEVVDIMQNNIGRVMERGQRLEDLHDKSGEHLFPQ